jgi:pre-mRNA-splicing factor CWC26
MSKLSSYLAQHYLTPSSTSNPDSSDSRPKKRRKKDKHAQSSGLIIADDDDLLLSGTAGRDGDDERDGVPTMCEGQVKSAEFRKKKGSTWNTIAGEGGDAVSGAATKGQSTGGTDKDEDEEANRILSEAADAQAQRRQEIEMEDAPAIVEDADGAAGQRMESGVRSGLQTASDTAALVEAEQRREREERRREKEQKKRAKKENVEDEVANQTIYRDASGRVINLSEQHAKKAAEEREKALQKQREREEAMGEVQRRQKEERKQELEDAKFLTLGRDADDEEMNEMMRKQRRWDDPMAQYLAEQSGGEDEGKSVAVAVAATKKSAGAVKAKGKTYQGTAAPNRYGILPGHRWDGVDRGNGFEKEWFQARSRSKRNNDLSYQWQMDE